MKFVPVFLLVCGVAHGLQAYVLNEATLPLMGDDRLYDVMPPAVTVESTRALEKSVVGGLDMTVTGTAARQAPAGTGKKIGFFQWLLGSGE